MSKTLYLLAAMMFLAGCSDSREPTSGETPEEQGTFDPMTDQLEKARKVEAQALQRKNDIDEALDNPGAAPADDRR